MARTLVTIVETSTRYFTKEYDLPEDEAEALALDVVDPRADGGWEESVDMDTYSLDVFEVEPLEVDEDDEEQEQ